MDQRTSPAQILEAELLALQRTLLGLKPNAVVKAENDLASARKNRAEVAAKYEAVTVALRDAKSTTPSVEMRMLADALQKADDRIATLRIALGVERRAWAPLVFRSFAPPTERMAPTLERCLAILDAAVTVYAEFDSYCARNDLGGGWPLPQKARPLEYVARDLRKFLKEQSK